MIEQEELKIHNNEINTHIEIFKTMEKLKNQNSRYSLVIFDNNVNFINPFFLILLLQYQKQSNKFIVIDSIDCVDKIQVYIENFLTQQIQFKNVEIESVNERIDYVQKFSKGQPSVSKIFWYTKKRINKSRLPYKFCDDKDNKDIKSFLPILSLTNETKNTIDNPDDRVESNIKNNCIDLYKKISVDYRDDNDYEEELKKSIEQILKKIGRPTFEDFLDENDIKEKEDEKEKYSKHLKMLEHSLVGIFFELFHNVKKHTKLDNPIKLAGNKSLKYSNAYISNSYNDNLKSYEFIISDDFETGFMKSFQTTLRKDQKKLIIKLPNHNNLLDKNQKDLLEELKKKRKEEAHNSALIDSIIELSKPIQKIDNDTQEDDIEILKGLFRIEDTFGLREIQRLTLHFGIPMLMSLMQKLRGKLDIYVHRNERYYHIKFDGNSEEASYVDQLKDDSKIFKSLRGTHIYISFPHSGLIEYIKSQSNNKSETHQLILKNHTLKKMFKEKDTIQKDIDSFQIIRQENLSKELYRKNIREHIIIKYDGIKENYTISDFFREIYAYALFHDTIDIYIFNFPIGDYQSYMEIIVDTIFTNNRRIKLPNIIFQSKYSFDVVFIGGEDKDEYKKINQEIARVYNNDEKDIKFTNYKHSKLFFKLDNKYIILPFVIFKHEKLNEYILGNIIKEYLEKNTLKLHVDTKKGYHLNKFYQFKNLFSDSQWINRIAFVLAQQGNKNTYFIGTDKYTGLAVAVANSFYGNNEYLIIENVLDENNHQNIDKFIKKTAVEDINYIVFSSVVFSYENVKKYLLDKIDINIKYTTSAVVHIDLELKEKMFCPLNVISNICLKKGTDYCDIKEGDCSICTLPSEEKPLYELDESNSFTLKNYYRDSYERISLEKSKSQRIYDVIWHNSIHFVHAKRGHNHYTFYTKTINFFLDNKDKIIDYLSLYNNTEYTGIKNNILEICKERKAIIFAPRHNTNNNFIALVDELLFDNDATIYRFDKDKGEQNFYDLDLITNDIKDVDKTAIFFIDDEISSGHTLEYFYTLIRIKANNRKFDATIVMIDRTTHNDTKVICNYVEGTDFRNKIERLFHFTKLEIKPIKTEVEDCFLCQKQKDYEAILVSSVLEMNRFQIAERIVKLNTTDAYFIDSKQCNIDLKTQLKIYLKMYAVDFIYREFTLFSNIRNISDVAKLHEAYQNIEKDFYIEVKTYLKKHFLSKNTKSIVEEVFERICKYEISIALLKAIAFPKLAYFEDIRIIATKIIICRIRSSIRATSKRNEINCLDNASRIEEKVEEVFLTIMAKDEYDKVFKALEDKDQEKFFEQYKSKNNLNYINFLFITAAYLDINTILEEEVIKFYYYVSNYVKKSELQFKHKLLHVYPTAVKLVTTKYKDKASYFDTQLIKFYKDEITFLYNTREAIDRGGHGTKRFSLVNALFVENIETMNIAKTRDTSNLYEQLTDIIVYLETHCKEKYNEYISYESKIINDPESKANTSFGENFKVEKIYINEKMKRKYHNYINENKNLNYIKYIEESRLLDVTDNLNELLVDDQIYPLYLGGRSNPNIVGGIKAIFMQDDTYQNKEDAIKEYIDCTWSNHWIEDYEIDGVKKTCTVIRLVDIDYKKLEDLSNDDDIKSNSNLWFKPIGLLVVSHDGNYSSHLLYSRILLSMQKSIVEFFKDQFDYGRFQEETKKGYLEQSHDALQKVLERISHTYGKYIKISKHIEGLKNCSYSPEKILDMVKKYTIGLEYIFSIGSLYNADKKYEEKNKIQNQLWIVDFADDFTDSIADFLEVVPFFSTKEILTSNIEKLEGVNYIFKYSDNSSKNLCLRLKDSDLYTIVFEIIFNALRSNKNKKSLVIELYLAENGIYIRNNGFDIEDNDKIFDENFSKNNGTGIGLYNIKKYLDINGMIITASNYGKPYNVEFCIKEK